MLSWVSDEWESYWYPPTPEDELRRAKVRVRRKVGDIERKVAKDEIQERALAKKLVDFSSTLKREQLEPIARSLVRTRESLKKMRSVQNSVSAIGNHMEAVDASVMVREVLQVAADAMAAVGTGSLRGVTEDARAVHIQLAQLQAIEETASDAITDGDEQTIADDLVNEVIEHAAISAMVDMPQVPRSGPGPSMGVPFDKAALGQRDL